MSKGPSLSRCRFPDKKDAFVRSCIAIKIKEKNNSCSIARNRRCLSPKRRFGPANIETVQQWGNPQLPPQRKPWGRDRTCQKASRKSVFSGPWPTPATDVFEEGRGAARFFYTSCRRDRPSPPRKHHRASDTLPQFDGTLTIREDSRTFSVSGRGVSPAADRRQASLFSPSTKESRVAHGHDRTA